MDYHSGYFYSIETPQTKTKMSEINIINKTRFSFDDQFIEAGYFFSNAAPVSKAGKSHKILVGVSFNHPLTGDKIDLRVIKSILILCQPKEVIDAVVNREIKEFLQMFPSIETTGETSKGALLVK